VAEKRTPPTTRKNHQSIGTKSLLSTYTRDISGGKKNEEEEDDDDVVEVEEERREEEVPARSSLCG